MKKFLSFLLSILFLLNNCNDAKNTITDLIQPIKLTSGKTDSLIISDLFYSGNYNFQFVKNKNIKVERKNNKLFLTPKPDFSGMTLLKFKLDNQTYVIPVISKVTSYYNFKFKPNKKYETINLFGNFNGWNRKDIEMTDGDNDGTYEASIPLEPGIYQYKFFADGEEIVDPINPNKVPNGMGSFNSIRIIEAKDTNKFYLHLDKFKKNNLSFILEADQKNLNLKDIFVLLDNKKVSNDKIKINKNKIEVNLDDEKLNKHNTLRIAVSQNGKVSNIQTIELFDGKLKNNSNFTWQDGIIYSLMIDRFFDGDTSNNSKIVHDSLSDKANYSGGDLQGILDKINDGYFDSLGINTIWISPVYDNPNEAYKEYPAPHRYYSGYHGYWPISDTTVDEHFGSLQKLKEVVKAAHSKKIKVLLDFVSNHVHKNHPFFKEHKDWFGSLELPDGRLNLRFWDEYRLTTWFEPYLPSFDYLGSEEALEAMTDLAVWWLKETDADGYRHDAVKHVPNKFWRRLNEKIKKEFAGKKELPVYQIGETFGSYDLISSYVNNGQLSSQFNFNLYDAALPTFIKEDASFANLDKEMQKTFSVYGVNHLMGNIMDSHDKNRFMAYADGDLDVSKWSAVEEGWKNPPVVDNSENYKKLILYMAYMNSIPGLPVIYYGSEFGMSGASDPDNRREMRFNANLSDAEKNTLKEVSKIIRLRKEHSALRQGDFYTLTANKNIYAYIRSDMNERILIVLNKSKEPQEVKLELPKFLGIKSASNLIQNDNIKVQNNLLSIKLNGMSWKMFTLEL
ncbi:MAG: hypothetical protein CR986_07835 [Ignavibacteriae bacterium]|nr:MAG: hypothetical protein CR986_07835 [Ignavibacteriota bacterium]